MQFNELLEQFTVITAHTTNYAYLVKLFGSLAIFIVFWVFRTLFTNYIFHFVLELIHSKENAENSFLRILRDPLKHLIVLAGLYLAMQNLMPERFSSLLNNLLRTGIIVLFSSAAYSIVGYFASNDRESGKLFNFEVDKILIPFFSKILRFIVLTLGFVAIASTWGYDVNGFIAGLGLGGLAFALAAKDLLANIFSGIVIITDKPFSIGDWIKTNDVEGTIEDINFRSTRIRAFDQSMVTVPNSSLINAPIINFTKRSMRRITFQINVPYGTPSNKIKRCITEIERMLRNHPSIDQKTIFVKFDSFGESTLQLFLYFFTKTIVWEEYLNIKQDINLRIMDIMEREGVAFGFPSTSVYIETPSQGGK